MTSGNAPAEAFNTCRRVNSLSCTIPSYLTDFVMQLLQSRYNTYKLYITTRERVNIMPREAHTRLPQPVFHEPNFGEEVSTPDPTGFETQHPSDNAVYNEVKDLLKKDVVSFEKSRGADDDLFQLEHAYGSHGAQLVQKIKNAGKIIFHAFGDSGASDARKYFNELRVADQVTMDCSRSDDANRPAFIFHLGDVVYSFGEAQYYYDQFYEPFRNYPAPIFAIPGNHDSFVVPGTPAAREPLKIFHRNFCADAPVITSEAGSLHRTAMTQPGFYFTLNAPFVRIIGLFSNALEDPGLISSQGGHWHGVPDFQLGFLTAQLKRIQARELPGRSSARDPPSSIQLCSATQHGQRRQPFEQLGDASGNRQNMRSGRRVSACVSRGARPQLPALYAYRRVRGQGAGRALHRLRRRRAQREPDRARKKGTGATRAAHGLERELSGISASAEDEGTPARKIRRHQLRLPSHSCRQDATQNRLSSSRRGHAGPVALRHGDGRPRQPRDGRQLVRSRRVQSFKSPPGIVGVRTSGMSTRGARWRGTRVGEFRRGQLPSWSPNAHIGENAETSKEAEEGPGEAHARQGGAAGAAGDRARARRLAQPRHRPGNRGPGLADRTEAAAGQFV